MKKLPFYRRPGRVGKFTGLKERMVWQLSKGPLTGTELCAIFGYSIAEFNKVVGKYIGVGKVVSISATEWFIRDDGTRDRIYQVEKKAKLVVPRGRSQVFTRNTLLNVDPDKRKACIDKASKRAGFIKAGLYFDELESAI
ncbi:regulator [Siccibacter colletis]|uniref:Regulator n=1 Tax=Siccibacter colletis TaxID=1505757 RepID=A0ABY6J903_9ENTR|nr:regulator [Siccibacter colletis]UYU30322.1 regulator [Siccibacter colletis]